MGDENEDEWTGDENEDEWMGDENEDGWMGDENEWGMVEATLQWVVLMGRPTLEANNTVRAVPISMQKPLEGEKKN